MKTFRVLLWATIPALLLLGGLGLGITGCYNLYVAWAILVFFVSCAGHMAPKTFLTADAIERIQVSNGKLPISRLVAMFIHIVFALVLIWHGKAFVAIVVVLTIFNLQALYKNMRALGTVDQPSD